MSQESKVYRQLEQLGHRKAHVQVQAAQALRKMGQRKVSNVLDAAATLITKLDDPEEKVQAAVVEALNAIIGEYHTIVLQKQIGSPEAVVGIVKQLYGTKAPHQDLKVALSRMGTRTRRVLEQELKGTDSRAKERAAWALGVLGESASLPEGYWEELFETGTSKARTQALQVLGNKEEDISTSLHFLLLGLQDNTPEVYEPAQHIVLMRFQELLPSLLQSFSPENIRLNGRLALIFGQRDMREEVPLWAWCEGLWHPKRDCQLAADAALAQLAEEHGAAIAEYQLGMLRQYYRYQHKDNMGNAYRQALTEGNRHYECQSLLSTLGEAAAPLLFDALDAERENDPANDRFLEGLMKIIIAMVLPTEEKIARLTTLFTVPSLAPRFRLELLQQLTHHSLERRVHVGVLQNLHEQEGSPIVEECLRQLYQLSIPKRELKPLLFAQLEEIGQTPLPLHWMQRSLIDTLEHLGAGWSDILSYLLPLLERPGLQVPVLNALRGLKADPELLVPSYMAALSNAQNPIEPEFPRYDELTEEDHAYIDEPDEVQHALLIALAEFGPLSVDALPQLVVAASASTSWLSDQALQAIRSIGVEALPTLVSLLEAPTFSDRKRNVIEQLSRMGHLALPAVEKLLPLLAQCEVPPPSHDEYYWYDRFGESEEESILICFRHIGPVAKAALPLLFDKLSSALQIRDNWRRVDALVETIGCIAREQDDIDKAIPLVLSAAAYNDMPHQENIAVSKTLAQIGKGNPEAVTLMTETLGFADGDFCNNTLAALHQMGVSLQAHTEALHGAVADELRELIDYFAYTDELQYVDAPMLPALFGGLLQALFQQKPQAFTNAQGEADGRTWEEIEEWEDFIDSSTLHFLADKIKDALSAPGMAPYADECQSLIDTILHIAPKEGTN